MAVARYEPDSDSGIDVGSPTTWYDPESGSSGMTGSSHIAAGSGVAVALIPHASPTIATAKVKSSAIANRLNSISRASYPSGIDC